jgi:hypothetical protein
MKNRTTRNGKAQNGHFLSRAGGDVLPFQFCRSPKEKNDGTAWRGLKNPAHLSVIPAFENDKERQGTARNGNAGKGHPHTSPAKARHHRRRPTHDRI